jgi:zinc D-Ala-D-Ala carboxypeptidase
MAKDYFAEEPFGCRCGCGLNRLDPKLRSILNEGRSIFGAPIIVVSGSRCERYNQAIKGAKHSAHLVGPDDFTHAVDIQVYSDITRAELHRIFTILGIRRFEVSDLHLHIDNAHWLPTPILASVNFRGMVET